MIDKRQKYNSERRPLHIHRGLKKSRESENGKTSDEMIEDGLVSEGVKRLISSGECEPSSCCQSSRRERRGTKIRPFVLNR